MAVIDQRRDAVARLARYEPAPHSEKLRNSLILPLVEITYQLTVDDYLRAMKAHRAQNWITRWVFRLGVAFVILVFGLGIVGLIVAPGRVSMQNLMPVFVLGAMWLILLWVTPYFWARSQMRGSPSAKGRVILTISETGLRMRSQYVDSTMEWPTFPKWAEEKQVFAFFTGPNVAMPIPKRAFDAHQLAEFRELARRKIAI